jgi:hypothetical protein
MAVVLVRIKTELIFIDAMGATRLVAKRRSLSILPARNCAKYRPDAYRMAQAICLAA